MNSKEECYKKLEEFIKGKEKSILIKGTNQYKKHKLVMSIIDKVYKNESILFRINGLDNILEKEFLGWTGLKKKVKSGDSIKIGNNYYQFDSIISSQTWQKTKNNFKCAIVYPIDLIVREKKTEVLNQLFENKNIEKIFLISWTDSQRYDYRVIKKYYESIAIYDAEDENSDYHKRVLKVQEK